MLAIDDPDLLELATKSALNFVEQKHKHTSMEDRQALLNACASGFIMGARHVTAEIEMKEVERKGKEL